MYVSSLPSTHNKTFSNFLLCFLFSLLSLPRTKSLWHCLLGTGQWKEKTVLGRCGQREDVASRELGLARRFLDH